MILKGFTIIRKKKKKKKKKDHNLRSLLFQHKESSSDEDDSEEEEEEDIEAFTQQPIQEEAHGQQFLSQRTAEAAAALQHFHQVAAAPELAHIDLPQNNIASTMPLQTAAAVEATAVATFPPVLGNQVQAMLNHHGLLGDGNTQQYLNGKKIFSKTVAFQSKRKHLSKATIEAKIPTLMRTQRNPLKGASLIPFLPSVETF